MVQFCRDFFNTGELPGTVNRTVVCLTPKIKQPKRMTDVRPISLGNVIFRILSKIMANRLKSCLSTVISEQQSAFVEGRILTDNALVAFEVNHYIRRKKQGKNGMVGLKLDVSKAYNRLEWNYLEEMLVKFGFNSLWISRVTSKQYRIVSYMMVKCLDMCSHNEGLGKGIQYPLTYRYCVQRD